MPSNILSSNELFSYCNSNSRHNAHQNTSFNYGFSQINVKLEPINKSRPSSRKKRVAHHRNLYDLSFFNNNSNNNDNDNDNNNNDLSSSASTITTPTTTKNSINEKKIPNTIPIEKRPNFCKSSNTSSKNDRSNSSKRRTSEDLINKFEKLKAKAQYSSNIYSGLTSRLLDFKPRFTDKEKNNSQEFSAEYKMDNGFYSSNFSHQYTHPNLYSQYSTFNNPNNIYSSFNSNLFFNNPFGFQMPQSSSHSPPKQSHTSHQSSRKHQQTSNNTNRNNDEQKNNRKDTNFNYFANFNSYPSHFNSSSRYPENVASDTAYNSNIYSSFYPGFTQPDKATFSYTYSFNQDVPEDLLLILEDPFDKNKVTVSNKKNYFFLNFLKFFFI